MIVGISDKVLHKWLKGKDYMDCSDEGEAIAIGAGYYFATGKRAKVFMSADGLCNALNFLTSLVIPYEIEMNLIISTGRKEPPHIVMTESLSKILKAIKYDPKRINIKIMQKE